MIAKGRMTAACLLLAALPHFAHATPPADKVKVGIYISSLHDINMPGDSFNADFWVWTVYDNGQLAPLQTLHLENAKSVVKHEIFGGKRKNGSRLWSERFFQAVLRHDWNIRSFPFDRHVVQIILEEGHNDKRDLAYEVDTENSSINPDIRIRGWKITGFRVIQAERQYPTNFGNPAHNDKNAHYDAVIAEITLEREGLMVFVFLVMGAYAASCIGLLSFFMKPDQPTVFSGRMGVLAGSLLATVINLRIVENFLGHRELHTLVDKIHFVTIVFILIAAICAIFSYRFQRRGRPESSSRLDHRGFAICLTFLLMINTLLIAWTAKGN